MSPHTKFRPCANCAGFCEKEKTMEICDTHCHVYMEEFDNDRDEVLARAREAGVKKFLLPNVDASTVERMSALVAAHPGMCFPMMGIHPTSVNGDFADELKVFDREIYNHRH